MSPRRNFLLVLAYDGTDFQGWQRLPAGERSVQAELEAALSRLLGEPIEVVGAGRTDRGVHAEGQAASFHSRTPLSPEAIAAGLNRELPPDLACRSCRLVDPRFHARFRVSSKLYRYRLHLGPAPDPFLRRYSLHLPGPLDLEAMRRGALLLEGERDFRFLSNDKDKEEGLRRVDSIRIEARPSGEGGIVDLLFEGPGFLHNQVRIMAALLIELGTGRLKLEALPALLGAEDRRAVPGALGPFGLCLVSVRYALGREAGSAPLEPPAEAPARPAEAPARPAAPDRKPPLPPRRSGAMMKGGKGSARRPPGSRPPSPRKPARRQG